VDKVFDTVGNSLWKIESLEFKPILETMAWLEKASEWSAYLTMTNAGISEKGPSDPFGDLLPRPRFFRLWVIHIQKSLLDFLIQAGKFMPARFDGKDAGMMLLRGYSLGW